MGFFSTLFGGPSQQQVDITNQQQSLAATLNQDFNQQFSAQSGVLQNINNQLTPIASAGVNQQGFSPQELAAMNTQAINNAGAAARNAQQKTATALAGQGGGAGNPNGLQSGITQQIEGTEASAAANQLSGALNNITQQNYATGRQNFWGAESGENALAKAYDPTQFGSEATTAGQAALSDANQIQQEKGTVLGDLTKLAQFGGSFLTGGIGNLGGAGTGTSAGENVGNFFSGGLQALSNS